jgi:hypothetical protein
MGATPVDRPPLGSRPTGVSIRKRVPILGRFSGSSHFQNFAALSLRPRLPHRARDQASVVGVGSGSDCVGADRERARLRLLFIGCETASSTTSDFDPERVVPPGVG